MGYSSNLNLWLRTTRRITLFEVVWLLLLNCFIHFSLWGKEHWSPVMQRWTRAGGQLTLGYYQHPHGAKIPPSEIALTPPNCFVLGQNFHDGTVQVGRPKYFLLVQFFTQTPQGTWGQKVTALQFWALSGHVIPHYKSSKVGHFKATRAKIGQLRSFCNVARWSSKLECSHLLTQKTCVEFEAFGQIIFKQAYCTVKCQYFLKCPLF